MCSQQKPYGEDITLGTLDKKMKKWAHSCTWQSLGLPCQLLEGQVARRSDISPTRRMRQFGRRPVPLMLYQVSNRKRHSVLREALAAKNHCRRHYYSTTCRVTGATPQKMWPPPVKKKRQIGSGQGKVTKLSHVATKNGEDAI